MAWEQVDPNGNYDFGIGPNGHGEEGSYMDILDHEGNRVEQALLGEQEVAEAVARIWASEYWLDVDAILGELGEFYKRVYELDEISA